MNRKRLLRRVTQGALHNVKFADMVNLVEGFGFRLVRLSGSHHIFLHADIWVPMNLQEIRGEAKPYRIRQLLRIVEKYRLELEDR